MMLDRETREARAHTAYCALKEHTLTALMVAEDVTRAGLISVHIT